MKLKISSESRPGAIRFRKICLVIALFLFPLLAGGNALAQNVDGFLFQSFTGATTFNIDRSTTSTFQLDLNIQVPFDSNGITYFFQTGTNGSGLFSVIARNTTGSPYTDLTTPDSVAFTPANGLLDPVNNFDLGAIAVGTAPGQYFIGRLTMTVELTSVADVQKITVTLHNVTDGFAQVLPDTAVSVNMLIGDDTFNRAVNAADIYRAKMQSGMPVTAANFRADINANGSVTASDVSQAKANSGHTLP